MKKIILFIVLNIMLVGNILADTQIKIKPEFSLHSDGKAIIVNAQQFCPDADYIYIDTTTAAGKSMYSMALAANVSNRQLHIQTGCTCNLNCSNTGQIPVVKICNVLSGSLCQ